MKNEKSLLANTSRQSPKKVTKAIRPKNFLELNNLGKDSNIIPLLLIMK